MSCLLYTSHPDWGNHPDAVWALRDVSFAIAPGEFFGIAGHTGSGKSTLIQHMNGILHPTCGRVLVEGRDVADKAQAARVRADVGVVFQYPEHQLFADTVYHDVAFGPRNLKLSDEEVDARVRESLALVGLDFEMCIRDSRPPACLRPFYGTPTRNGLRFIGKGGRSRETLKRLRRAPEPGAPASAPDRQGRPHPARAAAPSPRRVVRAAYACFFTCADRYRHTATITTLTSDHRSNVPCARDMPRPTRPCLLYTSRCV